MKCHLVLLSTLTVIRGISAANTCLETCPDLLFGGSSLVLSVCKITDADIAAGELAACLDAVGRANVVSLTLSNNELTTLPSGVFDQLSNLETLYLGYNDLTTLPSGVFDQLSNLQYLFIRSNDALECLPSTREETAVYSDSISSDQCGCKLADGSDPCGDDVCTAGETGYTCVDLPCSGGDALCGDPHMQGLRGQRIDWSGVDGGWYSLIHDADVQLNVRLTAPLPDEFPDRQLMTGVAIMSDGHSLVIEVNNPYDISTDGCPAHVSPCLANGGLRIIVDGGEVDQLLQFSREVLAGDGAFSLSASNLPVECRQFGGDKVWARMFQEMLRGERELADRSSFEEWILSFEHMAAPEWCAKYVDVRGLADLQSTHSIFKIDTSTVTVRLNVGTNFQGGGEQAWDGRVLPDLEFWQMDVGLDGLDIENPVLSGILGETARPVYDKYGLEIMEGFGAFRGTVEDYRVSDALGTHFTLLQKAENTRK